MDLIFKIIKDFLRPDLVLACFQIDFSHYSVNLCQIHMGSIEVVTFRLVLKLERILI